MHFITIMSERKRRYSSMRDQHFDNNFDGGNALSIRLRPRKVVRPTIVLPPPDAFDCFVFVFVFVGRAKVGERAS